HRSVRRVRDDGGLIGGRGGPSGSRGHVLWFESVQGSAAATDLGSGRPVRWIASGRPVRWIAPARPCVMQITDRDPLADCVVRIA
ncbi:MAG: hypothetical protein ACHQTF_06070, partial [Gemmatimonadales bacterium]